MTTNIAGHARPTTVPDELTRRDFALHDEFLQTVIEDETLQAEIPNGALLVLLPDDDAELTEAKPCLGRRGGSARLGCLPAPRSPRLSRMRVGPIGAGRLGHRPTLD